jgi:KDO2-lipid IV(A) lauroyltransferase
MTQPTLPQKYAHPKYWGVWLGIACMYVIAWLPTRVQWAISRALTTLVMPLAKRRTRITTINLGLCFPELDYDERQALIKKTLTSNVMGFFETAVAWCRSPKHMKNKMRIEGLEHYEAAKQRDAGILLLGGHFSILDFSGVLMSHIDEVDISYRAHNNPVFNWFMERSRNRYFGKMYGRKDLRGFIRCLKQKRALWYTTDQDLGAKNSIFAPFFGVEAATINSTPRLLKMTGATLLPVSFFRNDDNSGYLIRFHPPLDNQPSGDDLADAIQINEWLAGEIRQHPDQYMWPHRRFKRRPNPGKAFKFY